MRTADPAALAVAVLWLALPALGGIALGRALPRWGAIVAGLLAPVVALAVGLAAPVWELWDVLSLAGAVGVGLLISTAPAAATARGLVALALFAGSAEAMGRALLPPGPRFMSDADVAVPWLDPLRRRHAAVACDLAWPERDGGAEWRRREGEGGGERRVLHLGDSMLVFSDGATASSPTAPDRAIARLGALDPARRHVNLGVPGSSWDAALWMARAALARGGVDRVVLHAFLENDLSELGRPHPCCRGGALFTQGPPLEARCAAPDGPLLGSQALDDLVQASRDPLVLRVFTEWSVVVAHLRGRALGALAHRGPVGDLLDAADDHLDAEALERAWSYGGRVLEALRDDTRAAGAQLVVVSLPVGQEVTGRNPRGGARARHARLAAICEELGVPLLDAWPVLTGAPDPAALLLDDGYHLNARGHEALASWLAPHLASTDP